MMIFGIAGELCQVWLEATFQGQPPCPTIANLPEPPRRLLERKRMRSGGNAIGKNKVKQPRGDSYGLDSDPVPWEVRCAKRARTELARDNCCCSSHPDRHCRSDRLSKQSIPRQSWRPRKPLGSMRAEHVVPVSDYPKGAESGVRSAEDSC